MELPCDFTHLMFLWPPRADQVVKTNSSLISQAESQSSSPKLSVTIHSPINLHYPPKTINLPQEGNVGARKTTPQRDPRETWDPAQETQNLTSNLKLRHVLNAMCEKGGGSLHWRQSGARDPSLHFPAVSIPAGRQ